MVPRTGLEPVHLSVADFKSAASTDFAIRASKKVWRRDPESNRARRICNPLHNRFAIAPVCRQVKKREAVASLFNLEREKSLELSTSTLARLRSTN